MASISKHKDKWRAFVRKQGHKPMTKLFTTRAAAKKWARDTEIALESGDIHNLTNKTMAELIDRYKEEADIPKYEQGVLDWWSEEIGSIKVSAVRRSHIVTARKAMLKLKVKRGPGKGGPLAPATINRRVALLSRVCAIAIEEWDWLRDNPCHISSLPEDNERDRLLGQEERTALMKACKAHMEPSLLGFVLVGEATGMRAGEVRHMRWGQIDTERGVIQIMKSKNGERRAVGIGGEALDWLRAWKTESGLKFGGYVFGNSKTKTAPYNYREHWRQVKETAGVCDFRYHDLRHGFVTSALKAGNNPVMVQLVSGHKSSQMLKRYAHLVDDVALQVSNSVQNTREVK